ncbi:hypothetical protein ABZW11_32755 [Nonomuraea sp. NPDC004580]|uniref:hypothetical protein n=1 Tax=Nonomuraea sp. NPDC004580 TaxID=3154552 RepID=UPI0033AE29DC
MRKILAATALAGSMAITGLAVAPAAQAAPVTAGATQASSAGGWGTYYSSNHKAYTYGKTFEKGGKVYTHWYGKESTSKSGYVWFRYYSGGKWHTFYRPWNGKHHGSWSGKGIKRIYAYTCWGGKSKSCGSVHRIY